MVYITGDCHSEFEKLLPRDFPEEEDLTLEDFIIVCGDCGILNDNSDGRW